MIQTSFRNVLKGYKAGEPQQVSIMTLIPILTDNPYQQVGSTEDIVLHLDREYQTMEFKNEADTISIIPQGLMFLTTEHAQDRTVPSAHLLKAKSILSVDVDCLQPSQGGHIQPGHKEWKLLPATLKLAALMHAGDNQYDSLWQDMKTYLSSAGLSGGELIMFFKHYKKDLDEFVAQFEPVDKQIGAIVMFGNEVAGIELVANYDIWKEMWKPIIRDSYGSDAIILIKKGFTYANRPLINADQVHSLADLKQAVDDLFEQNKVFAGQVISNIIDEGISAEPKEYVGDFTMYDFLSANYRGQMVQHGPEHFIYLSAVPNNAQSVGQARKPFSSTWNKNNPYTGSEFRF